MADGKPRASSFSAGEQTLLMELYEEYKHVITKKGNTATVNRAREMAWQKIADRLNASNLNSQKRTWQQVKIKYKNIFQSATKKKTEATATGGGPPPEDLTPAEELALGCNRGRPLLAGIEGGTSSESVPQGAREPYIQVTGDTIHLLDPPTADAEAIPDPCFDDGPSASRAFDEETVSADTEIPEDVFGARMASARGEDVRAVYKRKLLVQIESEKLNMQYKTLDMEYKKLQIKKVKLEIQKLKRDLETGE